MDGDGTRRSAAAKASTLVLRLEAQLREMMISGAFVAGEKLSEHRLSERMGVSRNTLREAFRLLGRDGLLRLLPHRGAYVAAPDAAAVADIYRVRRQIQGAAVAAARPGHPALARMAACIAAAGVARSAADWPAVATQNMAFHRAMVGLSDSPRLDGFFANVLAELRLVFGQIGEGVHLHEPYVAMNARLAALIAAGEHAAAGAALQEYLQQSEQAILDALP